MVRFDQPRRTLLAAAVLVLNQASADAVTTAGPTLNRDRLMDGLNAAFQQASKTRTPDGRGHEHLKTREPACVVFIDIDTGITGDFRSAQLLARISDDPAAGQIPPCALAIADRFIRNVAGQTPEGAEFAGHAVADSLGHPGRADSVAVGGRTLRVRFDPDLHGLFAAVGSDLD